MRSFVDTVRRVLFSPRDFFRSMPRSGSVRNPLISAALCALIAALLSGVTYGVFPGLTPALTGMQPSAVRSGGFVYNVVLDFVLIMIVLVVITGTYQLFVRLIVGRNNGGLGATFRVLCYAQVTQLLLGWVPLVNLLAYIYFLYLGAFGFREVHSTTYGRAAAVVALPMLLWILLIILVTVVLIAGLSLLS